MLQLAQHFYTPFQGAADGLSLAAAPSFQTSDPADGLDVTTAQLDKKSSDCGT